MHHLWQRSFIWLPFVREPEPTTRIDKAQCTIKHSCVDFNFMLTSLTVIHEVQSHIQ